MYKYTRKYYINNIETPFDIVMKYLEIKLSHSTDKIESLGVSFEDIKINC